MPSETPLGLPRSPISRVTASICCRKAASVSTASGWNGYHLKQHTSQPQIEHRTHPSGNHSQTGAEQKTKPAVGPVSLLHHQRDHCHVLLVSVLQFETTVRALCHKKDLVRRMSNSNAQMIASVRGHTFVRQTDAGEHELRVVHRITHRINRAALHAAQADRWSESLQRESQGLQAHLYKSNHSLYPRAWSSLTMRLTISCTSH